MLQPFTQLGGLQLDKDLRIIMAFFAELGGPELRVHVSPSLVLARECFSRLQQVALLLSLDDPRDSLDYWTSGRKMKNILSKEEVLAVMRLRQDWQDYEMNDLLK
ncbi:unnamed protein product [Chrysoparadoxa australica]